ERRRSRASLRAMPSPGSDPHKGPRPTEARPRLPPSASAERLVAAVVAALGLFLVAPEVVVAVLLVQRLIVLRHIPDVGFDRRALRLVALLGAERRLVDVAALGDQAEPEIGVTFASPDGEGDGLAHLVPLERATQTAHVDGDRPFPATDV